MKSLRKAISFLLCFCLCIGLLPAAFAEEPESADALVWENEEPALEANVAKPTITAQPEDVSAVDGTQTTFTIAASGTGLSYQWQYRKTSTGTWTNSTAASGKTRSYTVNARTAIDGYQYRCKVTNTAGSVTSSIVTLTVITTPTITTQPKNTTAADGTQTTFTVAATGGGLSYQWQYRKSASGSWTNSTAASGKTAAYTVNARTAINGYQYRCVVSNAAGSATSSVVTLTVSSSAVTKPTITKQPANFSAPDGTRTTVSVTATGTDLQYQWQYRKSSSGAWTNSAAASGTTKTLTVNARTAINGYQYRCVVSNSAGSVTSSIATLTVTAAAATPTITTQPKNVTAGDGTTATFTIAASGTGLSYQWQYRKNSSSAWTNSTAASGTTKTFNVNARTAINGYQYRCVVSNAAGSVTSSIVTLTVTSTPAKPTITTQPKNVTAGDGTTATFTIAASGTGLSYQWQYRKNSSSAWTNSTAASGTTKAYTVNARTAINGYQYRCVVSNAAGSVTSSIVTLTVLTKPAITTQPKNMTAANGTTVTFTIAASGTGLSYQWQYRTSSSGSWANSTAASGKTNAYKVEARTAINGYQYRCKVSNAGGTVYSSVVTLTVVTKPTITTQPGDVTATEGATAVFSVKASGSGLSYQWQFYSVVLPAWRDIENSEFTGYKTATLTVPVTAERDGYKFRCIVSNSAGSVTSNAATLTMTPVTEPTITKQPTDVTTTIGSTATFSITASGSGLSYQWQFYSVVLPAWRDIENSEFIGVKTATLTVPVTAERDGYQFRCIVTNSAGSVTSNAATLTASGVWITSITFPDANFRAIVSTFDTDGSGVLSAAEIEAVTTINCDGKSIASLKGVAHFRGLKTLLCSNNQLTSLDVRGLPALFQLTCSYNNLTALDVSGLTSLSYLDCSYNQLSSLNLSGCTALYSLYCSSNALTSLDLHSLSRLNTVNCGYNQLTQLTLGNLSGLTILNCRNNPLTSLDVSGLSALLNLDCQACSISSLNVRSNTKLGDLNINSCPISEIDLSQNAMLSWIDCRRTLITTLDVSGCPKLKDNMIGRDPGVTIIR